MRLCCKSTSSTSCGAKSIKHLCHPCHVRMYQWHSCKWNNYTLYHFDAVWCNILCNSEKMASFDFGFTFSCSKVGINVHLWEHLYMSLYMQKTSTFIMSLGLLASFFSASWSSSSSSSSLSWSSSSKGVFTLYWEWCHYSKAVGDVHVPLF